MNCKHHHACCQNRQTGILLKTFTTLCVRSILFYAMLFIGLIGSLKAQVSLPLQIVTIFQTNTQSPVETTIEGTLHMYLVTLYSDSLQEIDHYRKTHKEGECITFILKTDKLVDVAPYLSQEEIDFLSEDGTTWQSEFMVVPDWGKYESFSEKDFAARFANKRIRVTGSLYCPMAGWQNATLVRMDFTKVELVE